VPADGVGSIDDLADVVLVVGAQLLDDRLLFLRANPGIVERRVAGLTGQIDIRVTFDANPMSGFLAELREERSRPGAQLVSAHPAQFPKYVALHKVKQEISSMGLCSSALVIL
jgi:hypothetical protein